jgi:hypothetical protein
MLSGSVAGDGGPSLEPHRGPSRPDCVRVGLMYGVGGETTRQLQLTSTTSPFGVGSVASPVSEPCGRWSLEEIV